ncbi:hypothetical protein ABIC03_007074 [Bradyrhizobium sp. RT6a]|uniref:hypothetical protein n=1 Tax=Bradyrhizobium sp. RT6a TaxID=3156381 RepID=UPI003393576A
MTTIVKTEKYQRGTFGTLIKWAFIIFNVVMLVWIVGGLHSVSTIEVHSNAERAGRAIGSAIGVASLLTLWVFGDIILGALVFFTRGQKVVTEQIVGHAFSAGSAGTLGEGNFGKADELIAQYKNKLGETPTRSEHPSRSSGGAVSFGKRS